MKKIYEFRTDEEKYMIVNMNPNEKKEAFEINKKEMQFDTNKFYQYVFADIEAEMEIEILVQRMTKIRQQNEFIILFQKLQAK